jgi:hypothetical protein
MANHRAAKREADGRGGATRDRIVVKFSGSVTLDPSDPRDVELFRRVTSRKDLSLEVEGRCANYELSYRTNREGEPVGVKHAANVKVRTVGGRSVE